MQDFSKTREVLIKACLSALDVRRLNIEHDLRDCIDSQNTETKSSAGDKHETARARMQVEVDRLQKLLFDIKTQEEELKKLMGNSHRDVVSAGSIVYTDKAVFFVATAFGKLELGLQSIHVVSVKSPFVMKMLGLKAGADFEVNGIRYAIEHIA
ncbi:MAG: hypothetical protein MUF75_12635 [Bacteroidia bacterium]|jgi:hypothetical protein|nr:hypothetical protein [Bacteroidia bacterium]